MTPPLNHKAGPKSGHMEAPMKTYRFTVAEHEEYGNLGFKPSWYPHGDPLGGMAVAHDILEHFPNDDGSAEGEFLALGAALYIRGDTGYFQRNGNVNEAKVHIASDFPMIWQALTDRDGRSTVKHVQKVRDTELLDRCREIVRLGIKNLEENGVEPEDLPNHGTRELIARWLAKGYAKAARRYRMDQHTLSYVFGKIEAEADKALKYAEAGQVFTVRLDLAHAEIHTELEYPNDY
jgi:hypothetical protein